MKIVKTCLPGSKIFSMFPSWLHTVVKQAETKAEYKGICTVHKARFQGMTCYIFDCDETQTRVTISIATENAGKFTTRVHFQRRADPVRGSAQRPPMKFFADREQGLVFDANTDADLDMLSTVLALQFSEPSPYPVKEQDKTKLTNIYKFWENSPREPMMLFAGKIIDHSYMETQVTLVISSQTKGGQAKNWRITFYTGAIGGAEVRNGHWLIYSPETKPYITSTKELDRFFRFVDPALEEQIRQAA